MLPYLQWTEIVLGPLTIQVWGLCVASAFLICLAVAHWRGKRIKLEVQGLLDLGFWIMLAAFIGGRVFYVFENFNYYLAAPKEILYLWQGGMAISGGFIGALLAGIIFLKLKHRPFWPYAELLMFTLPLGIAIGRLGCFFIFDHPGTPTRFFLGQVYLDGVVRHNHGLYLSLAGLLLFLIFILIDQLQITHWLKIRGYKIPVYTIIFLFYDGLLRLVLDFWRILDTRWYGLTAAQYAGIGEILIALGLLIYFRKR